MSTPRTRWTALAVVLTSTLTLAGCAERTTPRTPADAHAMDAAAAVRSFTAVLFAYIPDSNEDDFAALVADLEQGFEAQNPEIDLEITMDPNLDLYDLSPGGEVQTLLGTGSGSVNMVELDTILLGDLVQLGWVEPLPFPISGLDLFPSAVDSATVGGSVYGVPTYLCGNYIYSYDSAITGAGSGDELITILTTGLDPGVTPLVGNFQGSWTLPSLYVDAWADTHDPNQTGTAYQLPLDPPTMNVFQPVVDLCGAQGGPCLDGTYKDNTGAETVFGTGQARAFVGYSERLFYILEARGGDITLPKVISAPLGAGNQPVMFVDALMMNPHCTGQCATDAQTFADYMASLPVRNLIAFSEDGGPQVFPRYLLQARQDFYTTAPGADNLIYQQIYPILLVDVPYDNQGFPQARTALNQALTQALTGASLTTPTSSAVGRTIGGIRVRRAPTRFPGLGRP